MCVCRLAAVLVLRLIADVSGLVAAGLLDEVTTEGYPGHRGAPCNDGRECSAKAQA